MCLSACVCACVCLSKCVLAGANLYAITYQRLWEIGFNQGHSIGKSRSEHKLPAKEDKGEEEASLFRHRTEKVIHLAEGHKLLQLVSA